jgi:hypothetical protein
MAAEALEARQPATGGCAEAPARRDDGELDAAAWPELAAWLTGAGPCNGKEPKDWDVLIDLAEACGLSPLLYRCVWDSGAKAPAGPLDRLQNAHLQATLNALQMERALAEAVSALGGRGIRCIVLKGPALAETIYPGGATRPMSDLDLLVEPPDVDAAIAVLERLGYAAAPNHTLDFDRRFGTELPMVRSGPAAGCIDLHWGFVDWAWFRATLRESIEAACRRARPLQVGATMAWQLSPPDTLVYLSLHMAIHHGYTEVRSFADVDRLVRAGPGLDWEACVRRARDCRAGNTVYFALLFTQRLFGTPIPPGVLTELRPPALICRWVERMADPVRGLRGELTAGRESQRFLHFLLVDRSADRLRGIVRVFFPGREWVAHRYGAVRPLAVWLRCAWHPLHMMRLALAGVGQLVRRRPVRGPTVVGGATAAEEAGPC